MTQNLALSYAGAFHENFLTVACGTFGKLEIGLVDFPELSETPEITEMMENFTKVTKYLTKLKETLINYVWEKSHIKKQ